MNYRKIRAAGLADSLSAMTPVDLSIWKTDVKFRRYDATTPTKTYVCSILTQGRYDRLSILAPASMKHDRPWKIESPPPATTHIVRDNMAEYHAERKQEALGRNAPLPVAVDHTLPNIQTLLG